MKTYVLIELAQVINKGEKAFTESEEIKNKMIVWYGNNGTKLISEKGSKGFFIWNPDKI